MDATSYGPAREIVPMVGDPHNRDGRLAVARVRREPLPLSTPETWAL